MSGAPRLAGKTIVVGVTGGIAAYKACEVVSRLVKLGAAVYVVMTEAATKLVAPLTFQTLSGQPVFVDMWEAPKVWNVEHIALAERADLVLVAPATANSIAKVANGICDDLLSTVLCATTALVVVCPAMNCNMYANPIYQANEGRLRSLGYHIVAPAHGRLACGTEGRGRLPEPVLIVEEVCSLLAGRQDYTGLPVLVTAGPTREFLDPVRFLSSPSSGKMGFAVAAAAARRGAAVTLVTGPVELADPPGVTTRRVTSAAEMDQQVQAEFAGRGLVVATAAVSDYRPATRADHKIKKGPDGQSLALERTPDVLGGVADRKGEAVLIGFAAESRDLLTYARQKLAAKNLDLVVANDVTREGAGFGGDTNVATLVWPDGRHEDRPRETKRQLAEHILDAVAPLVRAEEPVGPG